MFSFLNPLFLYGAIAAAIPLLLHLLQRRRTVRVPFSTVRFLKLAQRRSSRRTRMENVLLWLLRTLVLLLLALAFAMPLLRTTALGGVLGRARRDVALVLDASGSMQYRLGAETAWERARAAAAGVVKGLDAGDRVCLFVAADTVRAVIPQPTADRDFVLAELNGLQPELTPSDLKPALAAAREALAADPRRRERELHVFTDGQSLPWQSAAGNSASDDRTRPSSSISPLPSSTRTTTRTSSSTLPLPPSTSPPPAPPTTQHLAPSLPTFVTLAGAPEPENGAPLHVRLDPDLVMSGLPVQVSASIQPGRPGADSSVALFIDGRELTRQSAAPDPHGRGLAVFTVPPLDTGTHIGRVETPPDNLEVDNAFHFLLEVKARLPVLCVGTEEDAFFLMKALTAGGAGRSPIAARRVDAAAVEAEDLAACSAVFLCNALPLPGQAVLKLEPFVRQGGLLALFPGDRAAGADYAGWSQLLPAVPTAVRDVPPRERDQTLRWPRATNPVTAALRETAGGALTLAIARHLAFADLPADAEVLAFAGADAPLILARAVGQGRVLLFSVAADRSWSNLPLAVFYLPLAHQTIRYAAGIGQRPPSYTTGRAFDLTDALPAAAPDSTLLRPDGAAVLAREVPGAGRGARLATDMPQPGIYRLKTAAAPDGKPALALNLDRRESDLTPIDPADIPARLGTRPVHVAPTPGDLPRLIADHRIGRRLGEPALWLALLLSVAELLVANRKARGGRALSETLKVDAAGRIKGGA